MPSFVFVFAAAAVLTLSGIPLWKRAAPALMTAASVLGLAGAAAAAGAPAAPGLEAAWFLPWGSFKVALDSLSIVFLIPVFVLPPLASMVGSGTGKPTGFFFGLLAAAMVMVVIARDAALFLIAWETMAISAFFAAVPRGADLGTRRAGWIYLVATHAGTLFLFAAFALWRAKTGSFALNGAALNKEASNAFFALILIGFGFKAALMPLHVWLPGFYAGTAGHVSAVLSGVMSKMGVYGLIRMSFLVAAPEVWWGGTLLAVGTVSAVVGIAFALAQNNLKKLLAYSSVENVGIIAMGIGLALLGKASGRLDWVALGLGGALFHVWNHGLFKSLLFHVSAYAEKGARTLEMDRLGGLAQRMPKTALLFGIGAAAISGLPPFNGFISELLIYLGLFGTLGLDGGTARLGASVAAAALSMAGALAVAGLVKAYGTTFLGAARTASGSDARDPSFAALLPLWILAALCAFLGAFPRAAAPLLDAAVREWAAPGAPSLSALAPLTVVGFCSLAIIAAASAAMLTVFAARRFPTRKIGTWDCGYAAPDARMQYTGSSWGRSIVCLFKYILYPKKLHPELGGVFPQAAEHADEVPDTVQERLVEPATAAFSRFLPYVRKFQQGQTHSYVLYILIFLIILLLIAGGVL